MSRPGYEADKRKVVLREWPGGAEKTFEVRMGEGPHDDRSADDLAWSGDGRELLFTTDHLGQHPAFAMDAVTGKTRLLVGDGQVSAPQSCAGGRVLFARNSLLGPNELYTVLRDGRDLKRVTHLNDAKVAAARFGKRISSRPRS
jgi:hypothetical protein